MEYIAIVLTIYYTLFYLWNMLCELFDNKHLKTNISDFSDSFGNNPDYEYFVKIDKEKRFPQLWPRFLFIILEAAVISMYIAYPTEAPMPLFGLVLSIFFGVFLIFESLMIVLASKALLTELQLQVLLLFVAYFVLNVSRQVTVVVFRVLADFTCYAFTAYSVYLYLKKLYRYRDVSSISNNSDKPMYLFLLGGSLLISVALLAGVSCVVDLHSFEYVKRVVEHIVVWCAKTDMG